jgi:outer membrane lipoprotein SlyB
MQASTAAIKYVPLALALGITGCAAPTATPYSSPDYGARTTQPAYPSHSQTYQLGTVDRIEVIPRNAASNVAGTVIGGIVGGLIGTQIGSGRGRTAATIAGAIGGAAAGNVIEGRSRAANETFRVTVRLDNGTMQTIVQDSISDLRTGDRVRVDGNQISRV